MTKSQKRLEKMRQNPHKVSYDDFILILEDKGYQVRTGGGSHYIASMSIEERGWTLTFARPHGNKKDMNHKVVRKALEQFEELDAWREDLEDKDADNDESY